MTTEEALALIDRALAPKGLTDLQALVFRQAWAGQGYAEIAENTGYEVAYVKEVGFKLWQHLSKALGQKVTKTNLHSALRRQAQHQVQRLDELPSNTAATAKVLRKNQYQDWGQAVDVSLFYGRAQELVTLEQWVVQERCRLVTVLGMGGIGKTALAVKLTNLVQDQFEYVIWRSLYNAPPVQGILATLIKFFSRQQETHLPKTLDAQVSRLLEYLQSSRCLLVLDNAESILQTNDYTGRYREGYEGYGQLLRYVAESSHQSCLVLTSREKPAGLDAKKCGTQLVHSLTIGGLQEVEAQELLQVGGLFGSEAEKVQLIQCYSGNPLALKIISTSVRALFDGNIAEFLEEGITVFNGIRRLLDEQLQRLSELEKQVMFWLAINRESVSISELQADIVPQVSRAKLLEALESLRLRSLIERSATGFTQQPVVMEYMTEQLIEQAYEAIATTGIQLLTKYALIKAQAKDYIRDSQIRVILEPLVSKLRANLKLEDIKNKLNQILLKLREEFSTLTGYGAGNIINLLRQLNIDLAGYDFSHLAICQAYLQDANLQDVNFAYCYFSKSTFTQSFSGVMSIAFSPDGKALATANANCEIHLWQVVDQQRLLTLHGHTNWVRRIAFSSNGQLLASASEDSTVKVWQLKDGRCWHTLSEHTGSVYAVTFSPNGSLLASGSNDLTIRIWQVSEGYCLKILHGHSGGITSVHFSPDGKRLVSSGFDKLIKIWDVETGECLYTLTEHEHLVRSTHFSPNGELLASASCDCTVRIWSAQNYQCLRILKGHTGWVWEAIWSTDSQLLASCGADQSIRIWNVESGTCVHTLKGHNHQIWDVAFAPDNQTLASASEDQTIKLWQVNNGECITCIQGFTNWVKAVAFSPTSQMLASGHKDNTLRVWDTSSGECWREFKAYSGGLPTVAFHPYLQMVAGGSQDTTIKLWDLEKGECSGSFPGHTDEVWSLAFSPNGKFLASSSLDHTVKIWDVKNSDCCITLHGHTDRVAAVAFSPLGRILASGSEDCTIRLWDIQQGKCIKVLKGHSGRIGQIAFSPDGTLLASPSMDQSVKVWDVNKGECLNTLEGHKNWVMSTSFCPDGRKIASASCDQTVRIWNVQEGSCLNILSGHSNWVWSVAFSHDGSVLASASEDQTIRLWNMQSGACLRILKAKRPYEGMKIAGVSGLTHAQISMLRELGAL